MVPIGLNNYHFPHFLCCLLHFSQQTENKFSFQSQPSYLLVQDRMDENTFYRFIFTIADVFFTSLARGKGQIDFQQIFDSTPN